MKNPFATLVLAASILGSQAQAQPSTDIPLNPQALSEVQLLLKQCVSTSTEGRSSIAASCANVLKLDYVRSNGPNGADIYRGFVVTSSGTLVIKAQLQGGMDGDENVVDFYDQSGKLAGHYTGTSDGFEEAVSMLEWIL